MKPATLYNFSLLLVGANKAKRAEGKSLLSLGVGGGEPAEELQLSSALQKKMQQHVFLSKPEWRGEVEGNKQTNKEKKKMVSSSSWKGFLGAVDHAKERRVLECDLFMNG